MTLAFYRRNYIEGLFLSSAFIKSSNYTMEQIVEVARSLREDHGFRGYIHLKTIPTPIPNWCGWPGFMPTGCRSMSSCPTVGGLRRLAPEKDAGRIEGAMADVKTAIEDRTDAAKKYKSAPGFAPAGQSIR